VPFQHNILIKGEVFMAESLDYHRVTLRDRWERWSQTTRLAIMASFFWPIFSLLYIWEPRRKFDFLSASSKFILMGVLPLVVYWGTWWVVQGFKKD